jgi:ribosomal protein L11 methyltransferase
MPFLQLTFDIGKADPEPLEEMLFAIGAASVTLQDSADDPILEPTPGATPLWPTVTVKALFAAAANVDEILFSLRRHVVASAVRIERIEDRAWEREWLKDFKPMRFGTRLWVCPGGMAPPSELLSSAGGRSPVIVDLDPGLAFGTGTHPTTALCLEWLDGADLSGKNLIDYGCGSGILAIAALKLGASRVIGVDIDEQALIATRGNAGRNQVSDRLAVQLASTPSLAPADILIANILAGPLHELAPFFSELVPRDGRLVLSGILENQARDLAARYALWFDMDAPARSEDWVRLTGTRR